MKAKMIGVGMVALCAVMLAGCSNPVAQTRDLPREIAQGTGQVQAGGVADWVAGLAAGKNMQCEYGFVGGADGKQMATRMFAKKEYYRTEIDLPTGMMITLFDGKTIYSWTDGKKQGTRTDMDCVKEFANSIPKNSDTSSPAPVPQTYDSPAAAIQNIPNISCKEMTNSVDFAVPSDVQFADQCTMLKETLSKMKEGQHQLPDSVKGMIGRQ